MIRSLMCLAIVASLAACGGSNPFADETETDTSTGGSTDGSTDGSTGGTDGGTGSAPGGTTTVDPGPTLDASEIPEELGGQLRSIAYDATAKTVTATIYALDSTPLDVVYERDASSDIGSYEAYRVNESQLDRFFVAMVGESQDGSLQAGFVGDGGQFNRVLQGGFYKREGDFDAPDISTGPDTGQVSYAGDYAGILNGGSRDPDLPVDESIKPGDPYLVSGQVLINANFADMAVNGGIYDRQIVLDSRTWELEDLSLIVTDIRSDGSFYGDVEVFGNVGNDKGDYGGVFGGEDAAAVAGLISIEDFTDTLDNETERGFFVLRQCGLSGDAVLCDSTGP